ncbi:MAG: hypothetical protein HQL76_02215, partial [Magnetococcales bacterium]|nr:hypothetical protein [Magnetococcales bacterium]
QPGQERRIQKILKQIRHHLRVGKKTVIEGIVIDHIRYTPTWKTRTTPGTEGAERSGPHAGRIVQKEVMPITICLLEQKGAPRKAFQRFDWRAVQDLNL